MRMDGHMDTKILCQTQMKKCSNFSPFGGFGKEFVHDFEYLAFKVLCSDCKVHIQHFLVKYTAHD